MPNSKASSDTCRSCGAEILWIETSNGKRCPVDASPKNVYVVTQKGWRLLKGFESHFATCPQAGQ